jgi:hypothetical protein
MRACVRSIFTPVLQANEEKLNEHHCDLHVSCNYGSSGHLLARYLFEPARPRTPRKDEYQTTGVPRIEPSDVTI